MPLILHWFSNAVKSYRWHIRKLNCWFKKSDFDDFCANFTEYKFHNRYSNFGMNDLLFFDVLFRLFRAFIGSLLPHAIERNNPMFRFQWNSLSTTEMNELSSDNGSSNRIKFIFKSMSHLEGSMKFNVEGICTFNRKYLLN